MPDYYAAIFWQYFSNSDETSSGDASPCSEGTGVSEGAEGGEDAGGPPSCDDGTFGGVGPRRPRRP